MPDAPQFHVVRVPDVEAQGIAEGPFAVVWPEPTDAPGERHLLVRLGDLPAPGEMGETRDGHPAQCYSVWVDREGRVQARSVVGTTLTRRAPPEPTWQEDLETIKARAVTADSEIRAALARIEKRLAGGSDGE